MLKNILEVGGLGCALFTIFLLVMSFSGIAAAMRDEEGAFRKERNVKSILGAILFISFLLGLLFFANVRFVNLVPATPSLIDLWVNAFGVFLVIHIYDLLVLDYLIVVKWHPTFLNLPDTDYYRSFRPHVIGFIKGIPIGIVASLVSSILFLWIK